MCDVTSESSVLFHWSVSVLVQIPCSFDYCSLVYSLKPGSMIPPAFFFLLIIVFTMQALFWLCTKFKVVFSNSVKMVIGSLMGDSIEYINYFGQYGHFRNIDSS